MIRSQFGFDPLRLWHSLRGLPRFAKDWFDFSQSFNGSMSFNPCLHDRFDQSGFAKGEYFWQDLLVAQWIHADAPDKHVDIGSRVDGFVAHIASFREIEVFDIRPLAPTISGVTFKQANLMDVGSIDALIAGDKGYCDSLSCLHALEHFGLGRYGDPINTRGYAQGLSNMALLLKPQGSMYLSVPMGRERVEFNANWIFNPYTIP